MERALQVEVRHIRAGRGGVVESWLSKADLLESAGQFADYLREQGQAAGAAGVDAFRGMIEAMAE